MVEAFEYITTVDLHLGTVISRYSPIKMAILWHFIMTRSNTSGFSIATFDYQRPCLTSSRNSIIHVAALRRYAPRLLDPLPATLPAKEWWPSKWPAGICRDLPDSPWDFFDSTWCETGNRCRFVWNRVPLNPWVNHHYPKKTHGYLKGNTVYPIFRHTYVVRRWTPETIDLFKTSFTI